MKKLISLLLAITPVIAFAQENYTVKAQIGANLGATKALISYRSGDKIVSDSATVTNGAFTFSGKVDDITMARITMVYPNSAPKAKKDVNSVYLVSGTTLVNSADSLKNATITGTKVNLDAQDYQKFMKPVNDARSALYAEYYAAPEDKRKSKEFSDYIDKKDDSLSTVEGKQDSLYILSHNDSYMSLQALRGMGGPYPDYNKLQPKFDALSADLRNSKAGVKYQDYLNIIKNVQVGKIAPEFAQADTNGNVVKLSSFRGKYVLVDFWASWCGPCRHENPNVVKAYNAFKGKNFTILSVSLDQPGKKDAWLKAIHDDHLTWNHVSDLKFWNNDAAKLYGIQAIPQNLLLDPDGKIIAKDLFGDDLEKKLTELFGASKI
jgi:peroxiredoxin